MIRHMELRVLLAVALALALFGSARVGVALADVPRREPGCRCSMEGPPDELAVGGTLLALGAGAFVVGGRRRRRTEPS